jgi:hypothetical protein
LYAITKYILNKLHTEVPLELLEDEALKIKYDINFVSSE